MKGKFALQCLRFLSLNLRVQTPLRLEGWREDYQVRMQNHGGASYYYHEENEKLNSQADKKRKFHHVVSPSMVDGGEHNQYNMDGEKLSGKQKKKRFILCMRIK